MRRSFWILVALSSHWRKRPIHLATLLVGLAVATALWSGVQALNHHARSSYDRATTLFGGDRIRMLVSKDGAPVSQDQYIALRLGGWRVSPVLEGHVQIGGLSFRLLGIEPVTLPRESGFGGVRNDSGNLKEFLTPPWQTLVAPETLNDWNREEGAPLATDQGRTLPPMTARAGLAPGVLVVDIGVAQQLLEAPERVSRVLVSPDLGLPAPPLSTLVGDQLRLIEPDENGDLVRLTESFHLNLTAFGLLAFVVGLFIVHSSIGLAFEQRLPMMRTLRACGVSARALTVVLLAELVSLALLGGAVGMLCGYLIATALLPDVAASLRGLYGARVVGQLTLEYDWWLAGLGMAILGALAAAGGSLLRAHRLPLLALAQPYAWRKAQQKWLNRQGGIAVCCFSGALVAFVFGQSLLTGFVMLAGLLLGAALALPLVLSGVLRLGERWADRPLAKWFWADSRQQLPDLSLALMALLLALAANVGVGTMVEGFRKTFTAWLDQRLVAEIYLEANTDEQAQAIKRWLDQRPEVEAILPNWSAPTRVGGWPVDVYGFRDHATYRDHWPLLDATQDAWDRIRTGNAVLISEQLARRLDVALGDTVQVPTPRGAWQVEAVGIYADYGNPKGQLRADSDALLTHWPQVPRTRYSLRVPLPAAPALIEALRATFGAGIRQLIDQASLNSFSARIFERTFTVTSALNALTLGIAGVALLTSLLTLSDRRLPQLAPLWAIGVPRRRLAHIELLKILALGLITALLSLPLGLLVAWCLVAVVNVQAFGWRLPFHLFPAQWLQLVGLALLTALLAAIPPMIRLRRTSPAHLVKVFADER
ncbi:ABC transporter permease [Microvirga sp. VF16]|uniref:ABC transporter permease n=1 Tax=Microvirga sp. VF16 TaxID=2807101 RepID=UPI00193E8D57|nr:ABC transporter permease [Microvirga sp. VF16]QRM33947.1 ABC transporter permease [Microvirga sp. VF16]